MSTTGTSENAGFWRMWSDASEKKLGNICKRGAKGYYRVF